MTPGRRITERVAVVAQPGAEPDAVLTDFTAAHQRPVARRLMSGRGAYDSELSDRWLQAVFCTPEFSHWWRNQAPCRRPRAAFFLEVLAS